MRSSEINLPLVSALPATSSRPATQDAKNMNANQPRFAESLSQEVRARARQQDAHDNSGKTSSIAHASRPNQASVRADKNATPATNSLPKQSNAQRTADDKDDTAPAPEGPALEKVTQSDKLADVKTDDNDSKADIGENMTPAAEGAALMALMNSLLAARVPSEDTANAETSPALVDTNATTGRYNGSQNGSGNTSAPEAEAVVSETTTKATAIDITNPSMEDGRAGSAFFTMISNDVQASGKQQTSRLLEPVQPANHLSHSIFSEGIRADVLQKNTQDSTSATGPGLIAAFESNADKRGENAKLGSTQNTLDGAVTADSVTNYAVQTANFIKENVPLAMTVTANVGSPNWGQEVGQKIIWMASGGEQSASITINPPDLGPMQVVIHVHESLIDATFSSMQPEVRHALESALPKLKEMFAEAGMSLNSASVNSENAQSNNKNQSENGSRSGAKYHEDAGLMTKNDHSINTTVIRGRTGSGMVDTFA